MMENCEGVLFRRKTDKVKFVKGLPECKVRVDFVKGVSSPCVAL